MKKHFSQLNKLSFFSGEVHLVVFLIFTFFINISGCTKKVLVPMDKDFPEKGRLLHVKLTSGKEVTVKEHRFDEGYLWGLTPIYTTRPGPYKEIKIALDDIESIRLERFDRKKTIITLSAVALAFSTFFYIVIRIGSVGEGLR